MPTSGTYVAYNELKPLEGDISQDIQKQEENDFRKRAEQREIRKNNQAVIDKYGNPLTSYDTHSTNLNKMQADYLGKASQEIKNQMDIMNNPRASYEDQRNAQLKLQQFNKTPEILKSMFEDGAKNNEYYWKAVKENKIHRDLDYEKGYQSILEGKGVFEPNENGFPTLVITNDDGTKETKSFGEIINYMPKSGYLEKVDENKFVIETAKTIGDNINQTDNGNKKIKTTNLDIKDDIKNVVYDRLFDQDGKLTNIGKSFALTRNIGFDDSEKLQKMADDVTNNVYNVKNKGKIVINDYNNLDVRKEERLHLKDKRDEDKTKVTTAVVNIPKNSLTDNILNTVINDTMSKGISLSSKKPIEIANLGGKDSGLNNLHITGFALTKNNDIVVIGKYQKTKSTSTKKINDIYITTGGSQEGAEYGNFARTVKEPDLSNIAVKAGYRNSEELLEHLKKINSVDKEKSNQGTTANEDFRFH